MLDADSVGAGNEDDAGPDNGSGQPAAQEEESPGTSSPQEEGAPKEQADPRPRAPPQPAFEFTSSFTPAKQKQMLDQMVQMVIGLKKQYSGRPDWVNVVEEYSEFGPWLFPADFATGDVRAACTELVQKSGPSWKTLFELLTEA